MGTALGLGRRASLRVRSARGLPSRLHLRAPRAEAIALAVWVAVVLAIDIWWVHRYRAGAVPEYDEAGYMAIGLRDFHAFDAGGLRALAHAYIDQAPEAPLVPLVTVVPYVVFGASVGISVATQFVAVVVLAMATYGLGRRFMPAGWAALAAGVTIALPVVSDFSRTFHFAVPAAALFTAAAYALARSDGLRHRWWAIGAGALVGLTVLSRTMTIAYLPGIGIAALALCARPGDRLRRVTSLAMAAVAGGVVAFTWYAPRGNYRTVRNYLAGTGYGGTSSQYGPSYSRASLDFWLKQARVSTTRELFLPVALALLACAVAFAVGLVLTKRGHRVDARRLLERVVASDLVIPAVLVLEGYVALSSSRNIGTAFALPWLPSLVLLCAAAASRVPAPAVRTTLGAALAIAALFTIVVKSDAVPALAARHTVRIPGFATVPVTDGDWLARGDVAGDGYALPPPDSPLPALHRQWVPFVQAEMDALLATVPPRDPGDKLLVGTGDVVLSTTRFALGAELGARRVLLVKRLDPGDEATALATLRTEPVWLLVTADPPPSGGDLDPRVVEAAAQQAGFRLVRSSLAPDGRTVRWWAPSTR